MKTRVFFLLGATIAMTFGDVVDVNAQYGSEWDCDPAVVGGFREEMTRNDIVPGEFFVDPPTLENLGFRWYVAGDSNENAAVTVSFRKGGASEWREAQPLLRVHHEIVTRFSRGDRHSHYRTGNLFAGSVLFLQPGTDYEVKFTMTDPDGGAPSQPKIVSVATRSEPRTWDNGRTLHVYPPDFQGQRAMSNTYKDIPAAYDAARPGDVILLHEGIHSVPDMTLKPPMKLPPGESWGSATPPDTVYRLTKSGRPGKPIVFRGAGVESTIVQGRDHGTDLFRIAQADHLVFEDLVLRRAHTAIRGGSKGDPGASWLTVRRCRIEDVVNGLRTYSENSRNWYIADNVITGFNDIWYPRKTPERSYMAGSHTGVNVYGQGHVICYNQVSRFSDSLAVANFGGPSTDDLQHHAVNIDFYNNDLSFATDDTFEADYGCHNVRAYRNRCYNAHTALSIQPAYGGPIYLIRNVAYGITNISYKWNNHPAGPVAYHNTTVSGGSAFSSPLWSNGHLRNNLMVGNGAKLGTGTLTPERTSLDYNGYRGSGIRWKHGKREGRQYDSLDEFFAATGYEKHGIEIDFDVFVKAEPVERGRTYSPAAFDLSLKPGGKPVDAAVRLPNINDNYTGKAPDLGALVFGGPRPHYGPRAE